MKLLACIIVSGITIFQVFSQENIGGIISYSEQGRSILFSCENDEKVKLDIIADDIIRIQASTSGKFNASKMIEWGFVKDDFPVVNFKLEEDKNQYRVSTAALSIKISKNKFRIQVFDKNGNLILRNNEHRGIQAGEKNVLNFDMPADEHFFGFGFMRKTLDARGHKITFKRGYRWKEATVPFFLSTRGYAFYSNSVYNHEFDFTSKSTSNLESEDYYSVTTNGGHLDFYIIYGPDFPQLIDRYTDLTGKTLMVPRWAFGLEYRVRYYADQEELLNLAKTFRDKEIPCDIMALCPGWEERAYSMKWNWSSTRYPQVEKMFTELDQMGFKVEMWESGKAPKKNITDSLVRKNWFDLRKGVINDGVNAFMQDDPYPRNIEHTELLQPILSTSGISDTSLHPEELSNISNSLYSETLFNEFRRLTNERAMVVFHAYNASVASHRWPLQWAGDYQAANGLLNASLSGHAMVSYDIRNPYAAGWHQGFFTPFSVVNSWAYYREPWLYSEAIEESHRLYACLRSRLVPYFYSSLWQSRTSGLPIERPMVLYHNTDPNTYQMRSQFMVGDWFLVGLSDSDDAPAGEKVDFWTGSQKGNKGRVYLPRGRWIDYWTGEIKDIEEAQWVKGEWPTYMGGHLFVKAGAIIPMGQVKNYIGEAKDEVVILDVYPYKSSNYQLYEDDGISYDYEKSEYALTDILCEQKEREVKIAVSLRKGKYSNMPVKRTFIVKMHSLIKPKKIKVDGQEFPYFKDGNQLIYATNKKGWYYDEKSKKVIIKLDNGWKYTLQKDGIDPLSTIPPTARYERITWDEASSIEEKDRLINVQLPEKAVAIFSSNIDALPADGFSTAIIKLRFQNVKQAIGKLNFKIEGQAKFLNGGTELSIDPSENIQFKLIAGSEPGAVKVSLTAEGVEPGSFEFPVYGKPVQLKVEKTNSIFVADNKNELKLTAKLYDKADRQILNIASPVAVKIEGEAFFKNSLKTETIIFKDGVADFSIKSTMKPGHVKISSRFMGLRGNVIETSSKKGEMQVRINPPEKIRLDSDGGWIPDDVDVFVNFRAGGLLVLNGTNEVTLNVYNKQNKLLDTYKQKAKKGEAIFKDITYYKRPAQCLFEIKCEGYQTIKRKVFANTWDIVAGKK